MFLDLILDQQIDDIDRGDSATNTVLVKRLSRRDREPSACRAGAVRHLDDLVRDLLFR